MTIDEAIEHAKELAMTCDDKACAAEHAQLAEWLSLLNVYTDTHMAEEVQRARHEMHGWQLEWKREMERRKELEAENAKLRDLVHKQDVLTKAVHAYWAGGERSLDDFNVMMDANAQVLSLMRECGIAVDDD